jgi:outer membrane immunogenic protein
MPMRRITAILSTLIAVSGPAAAADLYTPQPAWVPPPSWTGFYVGLNAGGGFGNSRNQFNLNGVQFAPSFSNSLDGALGGAQGGYNWQMGSFVLGLEADIQITGLRASRNAPCGTGLCGGLPFNASFTQKLPWFGTVRPRIGYAAGNWLLYATGGFAYAQLENDATATFGAFSATHDSSQTRTGWTLGGGTEFAFAPHWTAKLEYLYANLGRNTTIFTPFPLPAIGNAARVDLSVVRTGVNYRF